MLKKLKKAWLEAIRFSGTFTGCMSRKHFWQTVPVAYFVAFVLGFGLFTEHALSKHGNVQQLHTQDVDVVVDQLRVCSTHDQYADAGELESHQLGLGTHTP